MQTLIYIALGGALGAVFRYAVTNGVHALVGRGFPYGTLTVNVLGSLIMGVTYIIFIERVSNNLPLRVMIITGFLGAFTTFSTFSIETFNLLENGEAAKALMNVLISVVLCLLAAWAGVIIGREL
ncbi:MAG: fluoride efflux transporter CrcB [Gammaproteobacteria bacterium]|nr:fluoride efflux transporter CrcB [Gammaproteobacteria bacterium]